MTAAPGDVERVAEVHLWEQKHPYYCNEGNYFDNNCSSEYQSWPNFLSEASEEDLDMNLIFRFDWYEGEDYGASDFNGDPYYRNGRLLLFYMGQRKGLYRWAEVSVCRADEPSVIEFLKERWNHMKLLWAPFSELPLTTEPAR